MTFFIEVSGPFQWKPGYFRSALMRRVWWGPFAFAWTRCNLKEYGERAGNWRYR